MQDVGHVVNGLAPAVAAPDRARRSACRGRVFGQPGALLAYQGWWSRLSMTGVPAPGLLAVGGAAAPHVPRVDPVWWLPNDHSHRCCAARRHQPTEMLAVPELMAAGPADHARGFRMLETYRWTAAHAPLACDLANLCGAKDPEVRPEDMVRLSEADQRAQRPPCCPASHFAPFRNEPGRDAAPRCVPDLDDLVGYGRAPTGRRQASRQRYRFDRPGQTFSAGSPLHHLEVFLPRTVGLPRASTSQPPKATPLQRWLIRSSQCRVALAFGRNRSNVRPERKATMGGCATLAAVITSTKRCGPGRPRRFATVTTTALRWAASSRGSLASHGYQSRGPSRRGRPPRSRRTARPR